MKKIGMLAIAILLCAALSGCAATARPVNQTAETQGITTTTYIVCTGTVTTSTEAVWQQSSAALDGAPLSATETYYVMSYNQDMIADQGYVEYTDQKGLDTAAMVANQNNFESTTMLDFVGSPTGYVTYEESTLLDGAGTAAPTSESMLCPFSSATSANLPAFCNIVEMGGSFDGTVVSLTSEVEERHVSSSADVPVALGYEFTVRNSEGNAAAWMNARLMGARGNNSVSSVDITYNERTSAMGTIELFYKNYDYDSGMRRT